MLTPPPLTEMTDLSSADKEAVLRQTERLLSNPHFRNSRRYTDMLRYVVQQTLEGNGDTLKERTLGIEVFGREPSFDTAGDSIVRVAAAEVRKRIAQYYQEDGHEQELRIDLPSGSYVARFRRPQQPTPETATDIQTTSPAHTDQLTNIPSVKARTSGWIRIAIPAGVLALIAIASVVGVHFTGRTAMHSDLLDPFWKSPQEAILCIGSPLLAQNQPGINDHAAAMALGQPAVNNTVVPFADAITLSSLRNLLNDHGKPNRVQLAKFTSLSDLRGGPVILISGLDNPWTLRLTDKMRFRLVGSDGAQGYIVDSKAKTNANWTVDFHVPYSDRTQDYAVVAITHDDTLDQPLVIAAGIGPNGTMAAGEFLINRRDLDALWRMAPANWSGKNVEVVLATQVIQGNSGAPQIIAAEFW